jgi:hypothetical protein
VIAPGLYVFSRSRLSQEAVEKVFPLADRRWALVQTAYGYAERAAQNPQDWRDCFDTCMAALAADIDAQLVSYGVHPAPLMVH